jgi:hypothetical protein
MANCAERMAMSENLEAVPEIDTSRSHPARSYDYFLGGGFR